MNASVLFNSLVGAALLPPLNLVLLAALGLWLRRHRPRLGALMVVGALALLLVLSTKAGARLLLAPIERMSMPLAAPAQSGAQAIVVLGGGRIENAPEYGGHDLPSHVTFPRVHYGARLQRETGLPLLTSGGRPEDASSSEAALMARALREEYAVPVRWLEEESNNTEQNAQYSARLLHPAGIRRILLVTDALHMPRAQSAFLRAGFDVVPAPTGFLAAGPLGPGSFIPHGEGLRRSHYAMHEWIGIFWYRVRYGS
ncbi:MAG TPA: YdcF family protein [Noviherbaspirillum sp.]